ncbi:NAD(P)H azoreductase [Fibrella aestuarina BUZ 2]|uniref:NAD(P)H azoreductase n=1 Tax=Fibrella aestuarina BUZ 2 TaxID=1166018 RepID=I0KC32_9BACT|nr:SDR family oxidoreductase [Fibrella aestuarina]CCH01685.1 NAD(P)H azoreductase [Fibrella aestuarina BUZ 2]
MITTTKTGSLVTPPSQRPTVLITGATGTIGTALCQTLSNRGVPFRAMVRRPERASDLATLPGATVVAGDFDDPSSLATALNGMEQAFLLTPSSAQAEAQQLHFVEEARKAGVQHLVKLSQLAADAHSPVRFLRYHAVVENAIQASGLTYTFLRPNLFMQGLLGFRDLIRQQGALFAPINDASVSLIDIRDIADVAATVLTQPGHANQTYTLTGPQSLTHADLANALGQALHRSVQFVYIPGEVMHQELLKAGFIDWQATGLVEDYAHYSRGEAAAVTDTVAAITGHPARPFAQFAADYADWFR